MKKKISIEMAQKMLSRADSLGNKDQCVDFHDFMKIMETIGFAQVSE